MQVMVGSATETQIWMEYQMLIYHVGNVILCTCLSVCLSFCPQCNVGYAGDGRECYRDTDLDGIPDVDLPCSDRRCRRVSCNIS